MGTTKKCNLNGGIMLLIKNYEYFWMFPIFLYIIGVRSSFASLNFI